MILDSGRHTVNKMASSENNVTLIMFRYLHIGQQCASNIQQMTMLALSNTILLRSVNTSSLVNKTMIKTKKIS
jgi:hypothetical protein